MLCNFLFQFQNSSAMSWWCNVSFKSWGSCCFNPKFIWWTDEWNARQSCWIAACTPHHVNFGGRIVPFTLVWFENYDQRQNSPLLQNSSFQLNWYTRFTVPTAWLCLRWGVTPSVQLDREGLLLVDLFQ